MSGAKRPARPSRKSISRPPEPLPGPSEESEPLPGSSTDPPEPPSPSPYTMTEEKLRARNLKQKRKCGRLSTQIFASFLGSLSALSFGMAIGWSAPISHNLFEKAWIDDESSVRLGLLASMMPLGCAVGVISWTYLMHRVGPRRALQLQGPIYVANWWLSTLVKSDISLMSRFFMGITSIAHVICGEAFLKETVHPKIFAFVKILISVLCYVGVLMVYVVGSLTRNNVTLLGLSSSIPIFQWILLWFVPESPVFLFKKGEKAAEKSLIWYRGKDNIYMDLRQITREYESYRVDPEAYRYMIYSKVVVYATLKITVIELLRSSSGYYIFLFYSAKLWNTRDMLDSVLDGIIMSSFFAISKTIYGIIFIKGSRNVRLNLLLSVFLTATVMSLLTCYLILVHYYEALSGPNWVISVMVIGVIFFSDLTLNNCTRYFLGQYIPHQVYTKICSITYVFFWIFVFLNVFGFYVVYKHYPVFYWFGSVAILEYLGLIYLYFYLVDPKGKSLVQVQIEMGGNPIGSRSPLYS